VIDRQGSAAAGLEVHDRGSAAVALGGRGTSEAAVGCIEITVAILAHDAEPRIEQCLEAILEQTRPANEVVVIDNASRDRTDAILREKYPGVRIVRSNENSGCSGGRNLQLGAARHRYVMIVDDDAFLAPTCLAELEKAVLERPDGALWGPRVCYDHNRSLIQFDGVMIHYLGEAVLINPERGLDSEPGDEAAHQLHERSEAPLPTEPFQVPVQGGVAYLVDRDAALAIGGFDESYFFGRSDVEFDLRLHLSGRKLYSVPSARVFHRIKNRGFKYLRRQIRNRWMLILENYSWRSILILLPALIFYEIALISFLTIKGRLSDYIAANWEILQHFGPIMERRRQVQALKRLRDRDILSSGFMNMRADVAGGRTVRALHRAFNRAFQAYWACARVLIV
jgi:GT2 family glycosyltransferase